MTLKHKLKVLSREDMTRVHEASLKILEETGIVFHSEEALDICKKHGAKINDKVVHFPRKMVEAALETCPSTFKWLARNEKKSVNLGEGFLVQPNVGPVFIEDIDNGRRLATLEDFANIQKISQASNVVNAVGACPVDPSDVPAAERHLHMMYETLRNTDKPVTSFLTGPQEAKQLLDMIEIAFGEKGIMEKNHVTYTSVNPLSPLKFDAKCLNTIIEYVKRNQPIAISPTVMGGITGPISMLGTALIANVENLAGIVFAQLINPGIPVIYSAASTSADMKTANYNGGTPQEKLLGLANMQMAGDFYHIPSRVMSGISEANQVDCQAGYETMQNMMMAVFGGANIIYEVMGINESIMTVSYEKMIIDLELLDRAFFMWNGIDTSDEALALEVIQEVGHHGNYLTHPNTFKHFKDNWAPSISNWESYEEWDRGGREDLLVRANKKYKEILRNAPELFIDPELDKELKAYMKATIK